MFFNNWVCHSQFSLYFQNCLIFWHQRGEMVGQIVDQSWLFLSLLLLTINFVRAEIQIRKINPLKWNFLSKKLKKYSEKLLLKNLLLSFFYKNPFLQLHMRIFTVTVVSDLTTVHILCSNVCVCVWLKMWVCVKGCADPLFSPFCSLEGKHKWHGELWNESRHFLNCFIFKALHFCFALDFFFSLVFYYNLNLLLLTYCKNLKFPNICN